MGGMAMIGLSRPEAQGKASGSFLQKRTKKLLSVLDGPADVDAVTPLRVMARRGRSFRLAGWLLPDRDLLAAAELYAFCRMVDDLADEAPDPVLARTELERLRAAIMEPEAAEFPAAVAFLELGVPTDAAALLIDTVLSDIGAVRIATEAELLRYAHGAAGTVGMMMSALLGASAPAARAHAIDLGIAMQLTNIARDVAEDAALDRIYLPACWLPHGTAPQDIRHDPAPVFLAVRRVLHLADAHYRRAEAGFCYLPPRARAAIRSAARLYEAIGTEILAGGTQALAAGTRCAVPQWRRLMIVAGCLWPRAHSPIPPTARHTATA